MTKLERIDAAINHKAVDKIPVSFRASTPVTDSLIQHFDIDISDGLSHSYKNLIQCLGADIWASGSKPDTFRIFRAEYTGADPEPPYIKDGTFFYPIGIKTIRHTADNVDFTYDLYVEPPLAEAKSISDIKEYSLMDKLEHFNFSRMVNTVENDLYSSEKYNGQEIIGMGNLSGIFMICCYMRGMEQFLTDMALDEKLAEYLVGEIAEFCLEYNRRELESFGSEAMYYGTWDDVAGQDGLMFHPDLFEKYFLPYYQKLIQEVKKYDIPFGWHCCGSVHEVLPMMIDAGIDVFDVVQTSARDMSLENVHELYAKDVCLHGGLDVQDVLVSPDRNKIIQEIEKAFSLWGKGGGIIFGPSHKIVPDTPIENVLLMYETINSLNE